MPAFVFLSEKNKQRYLRIIEPVSNFLSRAKIHPNILTLSGLILSLITAVIYSGGHFFWAAWLLVLSGTCDILDGQLARQTGKESPFGALFDSTLDRFGELSIFLGLAWYFSGGPAFMALPGGKDFIPESPWATLFIVTALGGSFMVSYTKARAEGLGVRCEIGWMQRPERMTLLVIGSLLGSLPSIGIVLMKWTLLLFAILTVFTAIQRIVYVRNQLSGRNNSA